MENAAEQGEMVGRGTGGAFDDGGTSGHREGGPRSTASPEARFLVKENSHSDGAGGITVDSSEIAGAGSAGNARRQRADAGGIASRAGAFTGISGRNEKLEFS